MKNIFWALKSLNQEVDMSYKTAQNVSRNAFYDVNRFNWSWLSH